MDAEKDFNDIFDGIMAMDRKMQYIREIAKLKEDINKLGTVCGDCNKWMCSSLCPKEWNDHGRNRGPSCNGAICDKYSENKYTTDTRIALKAKLDELLKQGPPK